MTESSAACAYGLLAGILASLDASRSKETWIAILRDMQGYNQGYTALALTSVSGDHLAGLGDQVIIVLTSTTPLTITLRESAYYGTGKVLVIKDGSGNVNDYPLAIQPAAGNTIDGESSLVIDSRYASVTLVSNGVDGWYSI